MQTADCIDSEECIIIQIIKMFKDILLVGIGSFAGGSLRMVVSKYLQLCVAGSFPLGTMVVNVLGCFLIGIVSSLSGSENSISPAVRLLLATGFCGGFTTFSTFMNENVMLMKDGDDFSTSVLYLFASLFLGFVAVLAGRQLVLAFR